MYAIAQRARAFAVSCVFCPLLPKLSKLKSQSILLARLVLTLVAASTVTPATAQDCSVNTCRGPNLDAYKYRMMPPNFGGAFVSPYFQSQGEAIEQRKADYFQANPNLCNQITAFQGWGTDQFNFGPVPKLFMGVDYQNASLVSWTFLPCDPHQQAINFVESVGRLTDPTCGGLFQPNPALTYCYRAPNLVDNSKNTGEPPVCTKGPINVATGNKFLAERDYQGAGPFPLALTRYYNSLPGAATQTGLVEAGRFGIGSNWRHSYDRRVQLAVSTVYTTAFVYRPDGRVYFFNLVNGSFVPEGDINDRLQQLLDSSSQPAGWRYIVSPGDEVETYDVNGRLATVTTRSGLTQTLTYDNANDRLVSVTDPGGHQLTFAYDSRGRITTVTDPAGNPITYAYATLTDGTSNLVSVTYPDNRIRSYLYNEAGLSLGNVPHALTGIQDENGARYMSYSYDAFGRAVGEQNGNGAGHYALNISGATTFVTDPLGTQRTYSFQNLLGVPRNTATSQPCATCGGANAQSQTFDSNGNVASRVDFNGNRTNYTYDLTRNLETQRVEGLTSSGGTTAVTRTISTQWHASLRLPIKIAEPKRITTLAYDAQGNVTSKTIQATTDTNGSQGFGAAPTGTARTWTYTNTYSGTIPGLLIQQTIDGPRTDVSDVTTYVWDNAGNLVTVTNALSQITTLANYDAHGRPQTITDPNGLVTSLSYDLRGRLTSRNVGGELTSYTYDGVGQLTQVTLPDGSFLAYTYDGAHRLTQIQDNLNNKIVYTLDGMGNRTQEQVFDPGNTLVQSRSRVYNSLNRLVQDIGGANPATEITGHGYDSQGNLTTVTDPLSHVTTNAYDALNRLIKVIDPAASGSGQGGNTQYAYDGLDQITQVTDPRSLVTGYSIDGLGNLTNQVSPDTGTTTATFDAAGNTVTRTDARGAGAAFTLDALNRQTQAAYSAVPGGLGYMSTRTYTYDQGSYGKGRLTAFSDNLNSSTVSYTYDQKGRITQENRYVPQYGQTYITSYSYDSFGRLSAMTYPSGRLVNYTRDALGRISQIATLAPGGSIQTVVSAVTYQPFGAAKSWTFGNGAIYTRSFDLDGRISGYSVANLSRSLSYDAAGRITAYTHNNPVYNQSFGYDNLDRVTNWVMPNTNQAYTYDLSGNRTSIRYGANTYTYTYPSISNRLSSVSGPTPQTYQHDAAGNVISDGTRGYAFYASGALGSATTAQDYFWYLPDANQQRVSAESIYNSDGTLFVRSKDGTLIAENPLYWNTSLVTEYIYLNGIPVAVATAPTNLYYIYPDHLDTPRVVVNAANNIVWRWDSSDPFGSLPADANPSGLGNFTFNLRFPGQYFSQETGLHYNFYRDYDPGTGRYIESDPIGLAGGINSYGYAFANPGSRSDALGLVPPPPICPNPSECPNPPIDPTPEGSGPSPQQSPPTPRPGGRSIWDLINPLKKPKPYDCVDVSPSYGDCITCCASRSPAQYASKPGTTCQEDCNHAWGVSRRDARTAVCALP